MKNYDVNMAKMLQEKFCLLSGFPHFAPKDGICYSCGKQIYEEITTAKAASQLITSCPHCRHSFTE